MSLDPPISYIERTTSYYLGLGYDNPYRWARCDTVPFTRPSKSLKDMRGDCHDRRPIPAGQR